MAEITESKLKPKDGYVEVDRDGERVYEPVPLYDLLLLLLSSNDDPTYDVFKAAEQLRKTMVMYASTLDDDQALEVATIYPEWQAGVVYKAKYIISHGINSTGDPQLYRVVKDHTSQADWVPGVGTESLYTAFGLTPQGYPVWKQPAGAHDAYKTGDIVDYNGTLYRSKIDGNVYSPEAYPQGWELYTP